MLSGRSRACIETINFGRIGLASKPERPDYRMRCGSGAIALEDSGNELASLLHRSDRAQSCSAVNYVRTRWQRCSGLPPSVAAACSSSRALASVWPLAIAAIANGAADEVPALAALRDLERSLGGDCGDRDAHRAAVVMGSRHLLFAAVLCRRAAACDGAQIGHSPAASHVAPMLSCDSGPEPCRRGRRTAPTPAHHCRRLCIGPLGIAQSLAATGSSDEPSSRSRLQ